MPDTRNRKTEKRDIGQALLVVLKLAGWLLLFAAGCVVGLAKPETSTFYDRLYQTTPRQAWDMHLVRHAGPLLIAVIACTPAGFAVYLAGIARKRYAFPVSLVLTGLISIAGLIAFLRYAPGF